MRRSIPGALLSAVASVLVLAGCAGPVTSKPALRMPAAVPRASVATLVVRTAEATQVVDSSGGVGQFEWGAHLTLRVVVAGPRADLVHADVTLGSTEGTGAITDMGLDPLTPSFLPSTGESGHVGISGVFGSTLITPGLPIRRSYDLTIPPGAREVAVAGGQMSVVVPLEDVAVGPPAPAETSTP